MNKIDELIYSTQNVIPTVFQDGMSLYEVTGKTVAKMNETVETVNNMLTTGIVEPLKNALDVMADSGELGDLIQELIILDGGTF